MPLQGIPSLMVARGASGSSLLNGLQAYYPLSDLTDSSGNSLTLTNSATPATFGPGKVGNAATFVAASSEVLTHADAAPYQMGTGDFSMSAWINFTVSTAGMAAVDYGSNTKGYWFRVSSGGLVGAIADGTTTVTVGGVHSFNDGAWHLAILTASRAGNLSFFVDNASEGTPASIVSVGSVNNASGLFIGKLNGQNFLDGSVDEVGIWNRVLTSGEQTTLWNGGSGIAYPFS